ncbi:MAG: hypothetical protein SH850_22895 [Planctomycetaceae bacterium]|nr:hypothetical protein [Planctomycetaceae bacterium]
MATVLTGTAEAGEPRAPLVRTAHSPAAVDDGGYWVVSSRDLEGELHRGQRHSYQVFNCDAHGRRQASNMETLVQSLTPGVPVCFVMHGSFVDWETVLQDARGTNSWLRAPLPDRPLHVVFFTWPSDNTPKLIFPIDVAILGRRSARHSLYVAELISLIPNDHPICLVGHSHGARMVVSTLHVLGGGKVDDVAFGGGPFHQHRIRAVLAAGAFDHDWLNPGERYEQAVQRPELILNLRNRRDIALRFYPLHRPLTAAAAGYAGFSAGDRQQIGPQSQKLVDLDITPFIRLGHIWPHYYAEPRLAQTIAPHVFFLGDVQ